MNVNENPYALIADEFGDLVAHNAKVFWDTGIYIPIMAWGDPGVGKTQAVDSAARRLRSTLNVQHVADREPTEMGGIQWEQNGVMVRIKPEDLPLEDDVPTILFYDEVPQAPMMNKNLLARLVLDRQIGKFKLGNMVYVCTAGNYMHNRAGTSAMPSHLNGRVTHVHVKADGERWRSWAARNGVHPFVVAYNADKPEHHHMPNPDHEASPNPRSWRRVSDIEKSGIGGQLRAAQIVGSVGVEAGASYLARVELYATMPPVDDVLRDPRRTPVPAERSVLYAIACALAAVAKPSNIGAIIEYTSRFDDEEYQAMCLKDARERNAAVTSAREYTRFAMSERGQRIA